jgi:hypothetical protein
MSLMGDNQKPPGHSFRLSSVLYWLILILLIISAADIFSAFLSAMSSL